MTYFECPGLRATSAVAVEFRIKTHKNQMIVANIKCDGDQMEYNNNKIYIFATYKICREVVMN